jgi:intracellular septation protein
MHFLAEYFPLILFFVAFKVADIYVATAVAIVASIAQIIYFRVRRGRVAPMHWMSLGIIVVFGGATLLLHDETFIKWKPTVLYWLFAMVLLVGRVVFRRNLIAALLPDLVLPEPLWGRITWAWVAFLAAMGAANLYIAANFTTDVWVNFKIWGGMGLFMLAAVGTVASVARYLPEKS